MSLSGSPSCTPKLCHSPCRNPGPASTTLPLPAGVAQVPQCQRSRPSLDPKAVPNSRKISCQAGSCYSACPLTTTAAGVSISNSRLNTPATVFRPRSGDSTSPYFFKMGETFFSYATSNSAIRAAGAQRHNRAWHLAISLRNSEALLPLYANAKGTGPTPAPFTFYPLQAIDPA